MFVAVCFEIEVGGDLRKVFEGNRNAHDGAFAAVKGLSQGEVIDVIKLHACLDEHPDYLREGFFGVERGMGSCGDELGVYGMLSAWFFMCLA